MILAEKIKFNRFIAGMVIKNQKPISHDCMCSNILFKDPL
jgi:hypothetical protein